MVSLKGLKRITIAWCLVLLLTGRITASLWAADEIKLGLLSTGGDHWPIWVALDQGFLKGNGDIFQEELGFRTLFFEGREIGFSGGEKVFSSTNEGQTYCLKAVIHSLWGLTIWPKTT